VSDSEDAAEIIGAWAAAGGTADPEALIREHPGLETALRAGLRAHEALGPPPPSARPPGDVAPATLGEFRLLREIGRGAMGVVYEAEQSSLGRRVALKVLPPAPTVRPRALERFRREAQVAGRLHHPNIVPVFAFGEDNGVPYFAMEWLRGETLAQCIAARDPRAPREFAAIAATFAGVADGLARAHEVGVLHRDIKPSNLIFDDGGLLKVTDFGLAEVRDDDGLTRAGDVLGTPDYMSPEQARGERDLDGRSDVYSLGASLYETLGSEPPPRSEGRPPRLPDDVPAELEAVVRRALERDRRDRYAGADAFAADLRSFAEGRGVRARMPSAWRRTARLARRPRSVFLVGTAATVALLAWAWPRLAHDGPGAAMRADERGSDISVDSPWAERAHLSIASYALGAVMLRGKLVAISGFYTPRVAIYDPAADVWTAGPPLPRPLQYFGTGVIDERVFVAGGDHGGDGSTADLLVLEPGAESWTRRSPMPGGSRFAVGAAVLDGRLYVAGGYDAARGEDLSRVEAYDPRTDRWSGAAPLPSARMISGQLVALGGALYAVGGNSRKGVLARMDAYDPATNAWTPRTPLPVAGVGTAVAVEGHIVVTGNSQPHDHDAFAYDPTTDRWMRLPRLRRGRHAHASVYDPVRRQVYVVAGSAGGWLPFMESWTPTF
jgi:N-acetylneuraminic acid mutarotase